MIHGLSRRFWYATLSSRENMVRAAELHAATYLAIADGDGERAAGAAWTFLEFLETTTREVIDRRVT